MAEKPKSVTQSTFYNFIVVNSYTVFGALSSILVVRYLGPEKMGVISYAVWLTNLLCLVSLLGLPATVTKYMAEYMGRGSEPAAAGVFRRLFLLAYAAMIAVLLLFFLEELFIGFFEAGMLLAEIGAYFISAACLTIFVAAFLGMRRLKPLAFLGITVYPAELLVLWILLGKGAGIRQVLWVYAVANAFSICILLAALGSGGRIGADPLPPRPACAANRESLPETSAVDWRRIRSFFLTLSGIAVINAVIWQRSETFFLKKFSLDIHVGLYHIGFGLAQTLIGTAGIALLGILTPYFAGYYGAEEPEKVRRLFDSSTRWLAFFTLPFVAAGTALGPEIVQVIYGKECLPVTSILFILFLAAAAGTIAGSGAAMLQGVEKQGVILKIGIAVAVLNLLLDVLLIPRFHLMGAAAANAVSQVLAAALGLGYIVRFMRLEFPARAVLKTALSSGACFAAMAASKWLIPGAGGACGAVVIGPVVFLACQKALTFYREEDVRILEQAADLFPGFLSRRAKRCIAWIT